MRNPTEVVNAPERQRYEILVDGQLAGFARYRPVEPGVIEIFHTEVDPAFEGRGLGSVLAAGALDDVRARGGRVIATCPFIAAYLKRHTGYADLLFTG
jgi:predicted GNAT family acetyltransferase